MSSVRAGDNIKKMYIVGKLLKFDSSHYVNYTGYHSIGALL